jgi:tetratricopeptide (TPR) repeat protein
MKGDPDKALEYCEQALKISRDINDRNAEAATLGNMGIIYAMRNESDKAVEKFQQSLEIFKDIGSQPDVEKTKNLINSLKTTKNDFLKSSNQER